MPTGLSWSALDFYRAPFPQNLVQCQTHVFSRIDSLMLSECIKMGLLDHFLEVAGTEGSSLPVGAGSNFQPASHLGSTMSWAWCTAELSGYGLNLLGSKLSSTT